MVKILKETRTKTSIRYAKENDRGREREGEIERKKGRRRDLEWDREKGRER